MRNLPGATDEAIMALPLDYPDDPELRAEVLAYISARMYDMDFDLEVTHAHFDEVVTMFLASIIAVSRIVDTTPSDMLNRYATMSMVDEETIRKLVDRYIIDDTEEG